MIMQTTRASAMEVEGEVERMGHGDDLSDVLEQVAGSSLRQLQDYVMQNGDDIDMRLYHGRTRIDYIRAILIHHLDRWSLDRLKTETIKRGISMDLYGSTTKRKMDYLQALVDHLTFADSRPRWSAWKDIYLVGTEWVNYDSVFTDIEWDFDHLGEALDEGGVLYNAGAKHPVHLFGVTEPQLVTVRNETLVVLIPAIVAIISALPPPDRLGLGSVQMGKEEVISMKSLKMSWVPYIPESQWRRDPRAASPRALFLKTSQRRAGLKYMNQETLARFNYALPYIFLPHMQADQQDDNTIVPVITELNGRGVTFDFDWEFDEPEEVARVLLQDNGFNPDRETESLERLKVEIADAVRAEKVRVNQERAARKTTMESLSPQAKKALDELRIYKFYPQNRCPDIAHLKVPLINRYYGHAHQVL